MMYNNKLVCSVKSNNKILREQIQDGTAYVFLPFGSEYSLALKNLAGRNAVVHIQIDGKEVSPNGIYVKAGREGEITGFINGFTAERKFKFIEKTKEISDYRGDKLDDGMIRITWQFEKPIPEKKIVWIEEHRYPSRRWIYCYRCRQWHYDGEWCSPICYHPSHIVYGANTVDNGTATAGGGTQSASSHFNNLVGNVSVNYCNNNGDLQARSLLKSAPEGITVEGSKSGQQFDHAHAGELENETHAMIIVLRGHTAVIGAGLGPKVAKPIYVKDKKQCPSCGRKYKGKMEFCPKDGTALKWDKNYISSRTTSTD